MMNYSSGRGLKYMFFVFVFFDYVEYTSFGRPSVLKDHIWVAKGVVFQGRFHYNYFFCICTVYADRYILLLNDK